MEFRKSTVISLVMFFQLLGLQSQAEDVTSAVNNAQSLVIISNPTYNGSEFIAFSAEESYKAQDKSVNPTEANYRRLNLTIGRSKEICKMMNLNEPVGATFEFRNAPQNTHYNTVHNGAISKLPFANFYEYYIGVITSITCRK